MPATRYANQRALRARCPRTRPKLGPRRPRAAWTATAATAAPAPAPAPRTQRGGACAEKDHRERDDHRDGGHDEAQAADDRPGGARDAVGAEDRQLRRCRPRQQVAGGDRVLEGARVHPAHALHDEPAQQRDVRRRTTEPGHADPSPLSRDHPERGSCRDALWRAGRHAAVSWKSSTRFPEGSSTRICLPPTPVTISLRNRAPRSRRSATVASRSSTAT